MSMKKVIANPFQVGGMIRNNKMFCGRNNEIYRILSRIAGMQSISIYGDRLIGKSSLLQHLTQHGANLLDDMDGTKYQFHYINLQYIESQDEFYKTVFEAINKQADKFAKYSKFDLKNTIENKRVILCLDEFEQIIENDFSSEFTDVLRSLAQTGNLALIVSSKIPLNEIEINTEGLTSSFHNIFTSIHLREYTNEEANEFVSEERVGKWFKRVEAGLLRSLGGSHPYYLNLACSIAFDVKQEESYDFENDVTEIFNNQNYHQKTNRRGGYARHRTIPTGSPFIKHTIIDDAPFVNLKGDKWTNDPDLWASNNSPTSTSIRVSEMLLAERRAWTKALILSTIGLCLGGLSAITHTNIGWFFGALFVGAGITIILTYKSKTHK